jgi:hypothetical protein
MTYVPNLHEIGRSSSRRLELFLRVGPGVGVVKIQHEMKLAPADLIRLASLVVYSSPLAPLQGSTQMRRRKQVHPFFHKDSESVRWLAVIQIDAAAAFHLGQTGNVGPQIERVLRGGTDLRRLPHRDSHPKRRPCTAASHNIETVSSRTVSLVGVNLIPLKLDPFGADAAERPQSRHAGCTPRKPLLIGTQMPSPASRSREYRMCSSRSMNAKPTCRICPLAARKVRARFIFWNNSSGTSPPV